MNRFRILCATKPVYDLRIHVLRSAKKYEHSEFAYIRLNMRFLMIHAAWEMSNKI